MEKKSNSNVNENPEVNSVEEETIVIETEGTDEKLAAALKSADEFKDIAQRIQAEFDNYRKRNAEAVNNALNDGQNKVIEMLFPLTDSFERALNTIDESVKSGVELIYKQFIGLFEKLNVKEIPALGEEFDPKLHHAVAQCDDAENANKVVEVFQKGYMRNNKVLRAAMVKVAQ